jgi:hypothetical protein
VDAASVYCRECGNRLAEPGSQAEALPDNREAPAPASATPAAALAAKAETRHGRRDVPEETIWEGGYSPKAMIGSWVLGGIVSVALVVVGIIFAAGDWRIWAGVGAGILLIWVVQFGRLAIRRLNIHYRLTTRRFFHETGLLSRVTNRIEVIDIDDIAAEQSFFERFVGVGTIRIGSSDRTDPMLVLRGIDNVKQVAQQIDDARRAERDRRGLYVESI